MGCGLACQFDFYLERQSGAAGASQSEDAFVQPRFCIRTFQDLFIKSFDTDFAAITRTATGAGSASAGRSITCSGITRTAEICPARVICEAADQPRASITNRVFTVTIFSGHQDSLFQRLDFRRIAGHRRPDSGATSSFFCGSKCQQGPEAREKTHGTPPQ
ncbi:MAG: hypothetical protein ACK524_07620 [Planctomyces sp.]